MKKRGMAVLVTAMMIVSMSVSVFAAVSPAPGPGPKPPKPPVPKIYKEYHDHSSHGDTKAPSGTPAVNSVSDAVLTALAAGIEENDIGVGKVESAGYIAFTKYMAQYGVKGNVIATYTSVVPAGKTRVKCKSILAGCKYKVLMQTLDDRVLTADATNVKNGSFTYEKPAEPIVRYCIVNLTYY